MLDILSYLGKRYYLPWEWEFPRRHIPATLAATYEGKFCLQGYLLSPATALIGARRDVLQHIPEGSLFCLPT